MKKYNCSDPDENQLPYWMVENQGTPTGTKVQTQNEAVQHEDASIQNSKQRNGLFQPFMYQRNPFYPPFCVLKQKVN